MNQTLNAQSYKQGEGTEKEEWAGGIREAGRKGKLERKIKRDYGGRRTKKE
jgi:hypothetical protein